MPTIKFSNICKQINATIGDKSSIPTGGIILLKGAKNNSEKDFKVKNGCLCHFMLGIQVNNTCKISKKNISSKTLANAVDIILFSYQRATLSH